LIDEYDAVLWTRLGDALCRMSRHDDSLQAMRHALWLRERAGDERRARVTRQLIECIARGIPLSVAA